MWLNLPPPAPSLPRYAARSAAGQAAAITRAYGMAGVAGGDRGEIDYVECHATATNIGDGIELEGLRQASAVVLQCHCVGCVGCVGCIDCVVVL